MMAFVWLAAAIATGLYATTMLIHILCVALTGARYIGKFGKFYAVIFCSLMATASVAFALAAIRAWTQS